MVAASGFESNFYSSENEIKMESKKYEIYYIEYSANDYFLPEKFSKVKLDRSNYELVCKEGELEGEFTPLDNSESNRRIINKPELHIYAVKARRNFYKGNKIEVIKNGKFLIKKDTFQIISPCAIEVIVQKDPDLESIINYSSEIKQDMSVLSSNIEIINLRLEENLREKESTVEERKPEVQEMGDMNTQINEINKSILTISESLLDTKPNCLVPKSIISDFFSFLTRKIK